MTRHKTRARSNGRRTRKQSGGMFGWLSGLFGPKPAPVPGQVATPAVDADPNSKPGLFSNFFGSKKTPLPGAPPPPPELPPQIKEGGSRKKSKKHHHRRHRK